MRRRTLHLNGFHGFPASRASHETNRGHCSPHAPLLLSAHEHFPSPDFPNIEPAAIGGRSLYKREHLTIGSARTALPTLEADTALIGS